MPPPNTNQEMGVELSKREKGVIAQREYRKRHNSKVQTLKDDNQRLRSAIRKIHRAASKNGNHEKEFYDALSEAAELVGLEEPEPTRTEDSTQHEALDSSQQPASNLSLELQPSTSGLEIHGVSTSQQHHFVPNIFAPLPLWLGTDRLVRIYDVPTDVMPYLGEGLHTLAGCLYWACTYYVVSLWKKVKNVEQPNLSHQSRLDRIFNHSKYLGDHDFLFEMAQARIEFRKNGFVARAHPEAHANDNKALLSVNERVKKEYEDKNEIMHWWRRPEEVETYVRQFLNASESVQLQQVVEGKGSIAAFERFAPLFETLAQSFVCFGDGPRWNLVQVSMIVGAWLQRDPR